MIRARRLGRGAMFAALTVGLAFWVLVFVGTCIVTIQWMTKSVDQTRECGSGRTKDCVSREAGRVVEVGEGSAVTVAYRDETRRTQVTLTSSPVPAVGTRVWLERWNGDIVSLLERESELRHHTDYWPRVSGAAVFAVLVSVVLGASRSASISAGCVAASRDRTRRSARPDDR